MEFSYSTEEEKHLLNSMAYFLICLSVATVLLLQFIFAPYGRYTSAQWGPSTDARVAWFFQEIPALAIPLVCLVFFNCPQMHNTVNQILIALYMIHYTHRALIYPFLLRGGKPYPVLVTLVGMSFCFFNGYLQGRSLTTYIEYQPHWKTNPCFILGVVLFFCGMGINLQSDHILRNLRKKGDVGYKIPRGGMFEYVSGANFFGETLEWSGFALASCSVQTLAFAFFTISNIGMRAYHHHKWYVEKFEDYPRNRKAYIPYVF